MTRECAKAIIEADKVCWFVEFDGGAVPPNYLYGRLTDNGEHPEEVKRFEALSYEDQIKEVMSWS